MTGSVDIAVVGTGPAGAAAALALARDGFATALVGPAKARADGRTVALLQGSVALLRRLGAWPALETEAAPLAVMQLVDDTGSLFRPPPVAFEAREIGLEAFGWNVEAHRLAATLDEAARRQPTLQRFEALVRDANFAQDRARLVLDDGRELEAALIIAADGGRSPLRRLGGIGAREWAYPQAALTAILAHDRPHRDTSTEFHTRHGPFTLVPLPGRRSSLVWMTEALAAERLAALGDEALAQAIEHQARSMLGAMRLDGPRGLAPMRGVSVERFAGTRLALIGEAAHVFPPIGAQGLNLGLRDAAALRDALVEGRRRGEAPGSAGALSSYDRGRRLDVPLRSAAVHALNRSLLADLLPADLMRGAGLLALGRIGPLRRLVMREGMLPRFGVPSLMRLEPSAEKGVVATGLRQRA